MFFFFLLCITFLQNATHPFFQESEAGLNKNFIKESILSGKEKNGTTHGQNVLEMKCFY